jgi:hypothetical protein
MIVKLKLIFPRHILKYRWFDTELPRKLLFYSKIKKIIKGFFPFSSDVIMMKYSIISILFFHVSFTLIKFRSLTINTKIYEHLCITNKSCGTLPVNR